MTDQAITVNTALLKQKLKLVAPYAPARSPLPITSNIVLTADHGTLELKATDLDSAVVTWLPLANEPRGDTPFSVCLPAKALKQIINPLKDSEVLIERDGKFNATITAGSHTSKLHGMSPNDFPIIPSAPGDDSECSDAFTIDAAALKRVADRGAGAAAKDDPIPVLSGVLFEHVGGTLTATATDGARLASTQEAVRSGKDIKFIVPAKALKRAVSSLADTAGGIDLYHFPKGPKLMFCGTAIAVTIRLIAGTYPNWREVMPSAPFESTLTVEAADLLHVIKAATVGFRFMAKDSFSRAKATADERERAKRIRLEYSELHDLRVSSRDLDDNEFAAHTDAVLSGQPFDISIHPEYLVEAVKALIGGSTSSKKATATATVMPSRAPIPPPAPVVPTTDPVVLASVIASAQIRLSAVESSGHGPGTPQYDAANQRLVAARAARKARHGVPTLPSEPPVVERRKPDPAALAGQRPAKSVPATGSTIELCFTGPNSACLIRASDGRGDQTHVIMPMRVESKREPVPGRSGDPAVERDEAEQAA